MCKTFSIALGLIPVMLCLSVDVTGSEETPTYTLAPWMYGAIAWIGTPPVQTAGFSSRLSEAVEHAFRFWGDDPPIPPTTWEEPGSAPSRMPMDGGLPQAVVRDPATGETWRLDPLSWCGRPFYPLLAIVFPDQASLHDAINRELAAYFFCTEGAVTNVDPWIRPLMKKPRSMLCSLDASQAALVKEFAHWVVYGRSPWLFQTPPYVCEGISEVTAAALPDDSEGASIDVVAWASEHCLSESASSYPLAEAVGESFVAFLLNELGHEGVLDSLRLWALDSWGLRTQYQGPWRISLGLPENCR